MIGHFDGDIAENISQGRVLNIIENNGNGFGGIAPKALGQGIGGVAHFLGCVQDQSAGFLLDQGIVVKGLGDSGEGYSQFLGNGFNCNRFIRSGIGHKMNVLCRFICCNT